jgi:vacuolar-type H+-ATPase subunit E/Vma4|tara:strand:- start:1201 stop:1365 length:165 start_codon:yes stop_codon:yes gene_type:complete
MAKVHEEVLVITVSKLVKDDATPDSVVSADVQTQLAEVAEQLLGEGVIVEVNKA